MMWSAWAFLLLLAAQQTDLDRYLAENRVVDAQQLLQTTLQRDPNDLTSQRTLALLLYNNGLWDPALAALNRWLELAPSDLRPAIYRAAALAALGKTDIAETEYKRLSLPSASPEVSLGYAQLLHEAARFPEALAQIDQALQLLPFSGKLHFWKARILFDMHDPARAAAEARTAIALDPQRPQPHSLLLKIALTLGRNSDALQQAEWMKHFQHSGSAK